MIRSPRAIFGYAEAMLLAVAAQAARIPIHPPTLMPSITYVPFIVLSAWLGGLGPGLATTALCTLESLYFATAGVGALRVAVATDWERLGLLAVTGTMVSLLFERLKQAGLAERAAKEFHSHLALELRLRKSMLEAIVENSPVPTAVLRGPDLEFEMVNPAYQDLTPGESMTGRTMAQVWPAAAGLVVPLLEHVRQSQTVYHAIGMAVPLQRGPATAVEDRYFDFSCVPLSLSPNGTTQDDGRVLVVANEVTVYKRTERALRAAHQELATVHAHIPVALLVVDDDLRVHKANAAAAQLSARPIDFEGTYPGDVLGCATALSNPEGCGHGDRCSQCPIGNAAWDTIRNGARHEGVEAWLQRGSDGEERCLLVSTAPMQFGGRNALICAQDITGRKQAEEALRESRARLESALEEARNNHHLLAAVLTAQTDGILVCNTEARVIRTNPAAIICFGFDPTGGPFAEVVERLNLAGGARASLTLKALAGATTVDVEQRLGARIMETSAAPVHNAEGSIIGTVTVYRDITLRKRAEEALQQTVRELEAALTEKTVLLKEVHHRVKNNLAVISSLLHMKAEASHAPEAKAALADSHQRVQSIALIHEHLYGNDHLDRVHFGEYARELAQHVYDVSVADPQRISLRIEAEPIEVGVHRALPCALILSELLTNAFKHAFPDGRSGEVAIGFRELEPQHLELVVEDNGVGAPPDFAAVSEKSLGFRIVTILTRQLGGTLEHEPGRGTRFVLRFRSPSARAVPA